ncbi:MAG: hypothetical protein WBY88_15610, partial [Desulfosarcina sp.]
LKRPIPHALLSQFLPDLADAVADGRLAAAPDSLPEALIRARIQSALHPYSDACRRSHEAV